MDREVHESRGFHLCLVSMGVSNLVAIQEKDQLGGQAQEQAGCELLSALLGWVLALLDFVVPRADAS